MSLTSSLIREGIKYSKGGWTKTNSKPRSSGWFLHRQRKTLHKKTLDLFLLSGLGFEPDEQCYFDHDILHLVLDDNIRPTATKEGTLRSKLVLCSRLPLGQVPVSMLLK